jgi:hypothetical protein
MPKNVYDHLNSGEKNWKIFKSNFEAYWIENHFFPEFLFSKVSIPLYFEVFCLLLVLGYLGREGEPEGLI